MTLEEAFERSIKRYFEGLQPEELRGTSKKNKYDKRYFDNFAKHFSLKNYGDDDAD